MYISFLSVGQQVLILFILISVGFITTKKKFFTKESITSITNFVLYIVTPCVIIESFNRPFESSMLSGLFTAFFCGLLIHIISIVIVSLFIKDASQVRKRVLQFGVVFSNCGFMALPLQAALLGSDGVFYGATFIVVFNIFVWTYGIGLMDNSKKVIGVKKLFLNPGVIGVSLGMLVFLTPIELPFLILKPVQYLAALNTPLPMVVIGFYLADITSLAFLKNKKLMLGIFLRLIVVPLLSLFLLYTIGIRGPLLTAMIIAASAPTAANTVMFAVMFNKDAELSVTMVSVSTLFSILTMPLIIALAMYLQ